MVDIVIPNYNGAHLFAKNLPKVLLAHENYTGKIIVIDDGSTIEDKKKLREIVSSLKSKKIMLVEHAHNKGFSSAINTGVSHSDAEFVVLLNSDVVPKRNFLESLLNKMKSDPLHFGIGCMDESHEGERVVKRGRGIGSWRGGMIVHSKGDEESPDTFWISGGSCILRRELFVKIGGMDILFNPFYWEDIDLSYRAVKSGYRISFDKESVVEHYHGEGAILTGFKKERITTAAYRNQFIFTWKNITSSSLIVSHIIRLPLHILRAIKGGDRAFLKGLFLALIKLPAIMKRRKIQQKLYQRSDVELLHHIA